MNNPLINAKASNHFWWSELTGSRVALEEGIDNTPSDKEREALKALSLYVLDPTRELVGSVVLLTSAFRCPKLNSHRRIGGAPDSQHVKGEAADYICPQYKPGLLDLAKKVVLCQNIQFDQLILEYRKNSSLIHVSHKLGGPQRREVLHSPAIGDFRKGLPDKWPL